jgi:hypothetical protein
LKRRNAEEGAAASATRSDTAPTNRRIVRDGTRPPDGGKQILRPAVYTLVMCGRYTLRSPLARLADHFGIPLSDVPQPFVAQYTIAPTQEVRAARQDRDGRHASNLECAWRA